MIDIIILLHEPFSMFTIASLFDKKDKYRLHIFTRPMIWEWAEPVHKWALANIPRCYIYQTPWNYPQGYGPRDTEARLLLQFRQHWKNKDLDIERVLICTSGSTVFVQGNVDEGQLPTTKWMNDNNRLVHFSRTYQYTSHPIFKEYYKILDIDTSTDIDHQAMLINWKKFCEIPTGELFFVNGKWTRRTMSGKDWGEYHHDNDSFVLSATNEVMFKRLTKNKDEYSFAPTYFNGKVEKLIEREALGPKECINHNVMLRKSYMVNIDKGNLLMNYHSIPTLIYLSIPFDLYSNLIPKIPMNIRMAGINEQMLEKAEKQRKYFKKVIEAGYLLGKI